MMRLRSLAGYLVAALGMAVAAHAAVPTPVTELLFEAGNLSTGLYAESALQDNPVYAPGISGQGADITAPSGALRFGSSYSASYPDDASEIKHALSEGLASFTMTAWVKAHVVVDGNKRLFNNSDTNANIVISAGSAGRYYATIEGETAWSPTGGVYNLAGQWQFFGLVYDGTSAVDNLTWYWTDAGGVLQSQTQTLNRGLITGQPTRPVIIGGINQSTSLIDAVLDDVRLWGSKTDSSAALDATQVAEVMNNHSYITMPFSEATGTAVTLAYYQLDGGADNLDASVEVGPFDLVEVGDVTSGAAATATIAKPDWSLWRDGVGTPADNTASAAFDGDDAYETANLEGRLMFDPDRSFTAECWFKPTVLDPTGEVDRMGVIGVRNNYSNPSYLGWQLWVVDDVMSFIVTGRTKDGVLGNVTTQTQPGVVLENQWNYVAAIYDANAGQLGTIQLVLNDHVGPRNPINPEWFGTVGGKFTIGSIPGFPDRSFIGEIDEVRVTAAALPLEYLLNNASELPQSGCGDGGFLRYDVNHDCVVDVYDLSTLGANWLECTDPTRPGCIKITSAGYFYY